MTPTELIEESRYQERAQDYMAIVRYLRTTPAGDWILSRDIEKHTGIKPEIISIVARKHSLSIQSLAHNCRGGDRRCYRLHPTLEERSIPENALDKLNEQRAAQLVRMMSRV
jgi:hypothetical protein